MLYNLDSSKDSNRTLSYERDLRTNYKILLIYCRFMSILPEIKEYLLLLFIQKKNPECCSQTHFIVSLVSIRSFKMLKRR